MTRVASAHGRRSIRRHRGLAPYAFLLPYLAVTALFVVWPLINAIVLAFYQTNGPASRTYVGFDNFLFLVTDPIFHKALKNTTLFALASVCLQLPLSLLLAVLLNTGNDKAKALFRLVLFSPNLVGQIFVGILFSVLFTPRYGLVNRFVQELMGWGLETQWLTNPALVLPAIVLTSLWMYVGFNMIYFLAALQSVDKTLIDAARIDGANRWQVFRHVTLPSIRHVVVFVVVTSIIGSYNLFELPLALMPASRGNGPDNSGMTLVAYLYQVGFETGDLGLGSAVGWIVAVIVFVLSLAQIRLARAGDD
jgi:ABC-type sugar transport system permease subunit